MIWESVLFWALLLAAFACAVLGGWVAQQRAGNRESNALFCALAASALWAIVAAVSGVDSAAASHAETLRNLVWLAYTCMLFSGEDREAGYAAVRPVVFAIALAGVLQPVLLLADGGPHPEHVDAASTTFRIAVAVRLAFVIGALLLVHNLSTQAVAEGRSGLRWTATSLAILWICDLNFYTVAYLGNDHPLSLELVRALALVAMCATLGIGRSRTAAKPLRPSRAMAFQTISLLVIGGYIAIMVGAAHSLAWLGDGAPPLAQIGFIFTSAMLALIVLPSQRLRSWLKVTIAKHLFQHRYDYRAEWLRLNQTIGRGDGEASLQERVVQVLGDITDSDAGLLLAPGEQDQLGVSARWRWRTLEVPARALGDDARRFFEKQGFIVALDSVRAGLARAGEDAIVPQWLRDEPRAWAMVPLIHFDRLVGVVVLARPPHPRELDWEDFDLLRVVGSQLASYLAEQSGQEALLEASRFDEFNRRIAFVMHDVKNLASQLTLLCHNAERHGDKPAFRADMMVTVRNAADKLNGLIARLSRYGSAPLERLESIDPNEIVRKVVARSWSGPVQAGAFAPGAQVIGSRDSLEQVLVHLVQNALDATPSGAPVLLNVRTNGMHAAIEVSDSGLGMSAEFVRTRLFKPFVSTKPGGFGIGAFEARELVRSMQGRLDVESRENLGSRFTIHLPLTEAAILLDKFRTAGAARVPVDAHNARVA